MTKFIHPPQPHDLDHEGHPTTPTFGVGGNGPYRLHRSDSRNVVLQRRNKKGSWTNLAYCGNSARSVVRSVSELATEHWTPADGDNDLATQLSDLRRAIDQLEATIADLCQSLETERVDFAGMFEQQK